MSQATFRTNLPPALQKYEDRRFEAVASLMNFEVKENFKEEVMELLQRLKAAELS
ncbi:hypothetical protein [Corynebacterium phocae]|uniref:hypothetical protein n=1 Tax=Corynebacterium phocae TaxID=161895 RepID=UPI0012EE813F|nr:hypothetical protein [Corynebacterium phocae]